MIITTLSLRNHLVTALGDDLGTYTRPDGGTEPAIAIIPHNQYGYNYPPDNYKVTGIEGVILKPKIKAKMAYLGASKKSEYEIFLKFWSETGKINQVTELVFDYFIDQEYQMLSPVYMPYDEKLGILASTKLTIYNFTHRISD